MLKINNVSVSIEQKQILNKLSLAFEPSKIYAIMGPNGSGKSSLVYTLLGHPMYQMSEGTIDFLDMDLASMKVDERARAGIFVAFQYPHSIGGVKVMDFLRESYRALSSQDVNLDEFQQKIRDAFACVGLDESFLYRGLNEGFSGGEKKRLEVAQLLLFKPKLAILDEIDSGLDIDAIKKIASAIHHAKQHNPDMTLVLITHYQRILHHISPDSVHILMNGRIVCSGDNKLALRIEEMGYDAI